MKPSGSQPIAEYGANQAVHRLRTLAYEINRVAKSGDPQAIHDARVASRRLARCLHVFRQFFPKRENERILRRLRRLLGLAANVRNCDIALELLAASGIARTDKIAANLTEERQKAARDLRLLTQRWNRREAVRRWRERIGL
ncbi:MAG: CHAD domain-containing protein [Bryobacteraceae bacterium]